MKKSGLVLATLLAATVAASAGDEAAHLKFPQSQTGDRAATLDMRTTGSVKPAADGLRQTGAHAAISGEQKLGIDVNPWVMPVFH